VLVFELPRLILIRDASRRFKSVPAMRGDTADLTVITLWYRCLVEPPEVRPEEHKSVGRARRVSILTLAPAALGIEIGRGKLAPIGKRAQTLEGLRRERSVVVSGCGDGMFDEWLSGGGVGYIKVIEAARNILIQSYDRQIERWSASTLSLVRAKMERTIRQGLVGESPRSSYDWHRCGVKWSCLVD